MLCCFSSKKDVCSSLNTRLTAPFALPEIINLLAILRMLSMVWASIWNMLPIEPLTKKRLINDACFEHFRGLNTRHLSGKAHNSTSIQVVSNLNRLWACFTIQITRSWTPSERWKPLYKCRTWSLFQLTFNIFQMSDVLQLVTGF